VALDWVRAKTGESLKKQVQNFAGQYFGSFLVPMRTLGDAYSAIDQKENVMRDYRESPLVAPALLNLPKFSQIVPEKPSPVKSGPVMRGEPVKVMGIEVPAGIFRQLTGLSKRTKTKVEREIDSIGMEWTSVTPRTGVTQADRYISKYMAPRVEKLVPKFIESNNYQRLSKPMKRVALSRVFSEIRKEANKEFALRHGALALKVALERQRADIKEELKNRGVIKEQ
jgi:hypothetical protein